MYLVLKLFQNDLSLSRLNALRVGIVMYPFYETYVIPHYNSCKYNKRILINLYKWRVVRKLHGVYFP